MYVRHDREFLLFLWGVQSKETSVQSNTVEAFSRSECRIIRRKTLTCRTKGNTVLREEIHSVNKLTAGDNE